MHTDRISLPSDLEGAGQSHSTFQALADLLPALAWVHDVTGAVLCYNHGWTEYTGQAAAEVEGIRWTSAVHPDDLRRAGLRWKSSVDPARPYQIRCRIRGANGVYRWFQVQGKPIREDKGEPRWIALATDIDDQVRTEAMLRASHSQVERLASAVPHLIWSFRPDCLATYFNQSWFTYTGLRASTSAGLGWQGVVHPVDLATFVREQPLRQGQVFETEWRLRRADGCYRWHSCHIVPVRGVAGTVLYWYSTATDIQERKAVQQQRESLITELLGRVRNILASVRHIATETREASTSLAEFFPAFDARLDALGRAQLLLARDGGQAASLEEIVYNEVGAVQGCVGENVDISGPEIRLRPRAVQVLTLAVHELATNAMQYGALSVPSGTVKINWRRETSGGRARLVIQWNEQGVPLVDLQPSRRGQGRQMIEEALPAGFRANTNLAFAPGGIRCTIEIPWQSDLFAG
ncbi:MAG: PAS domain-containing protein [Acetobacteraceae bacterium]|nr:PAS domain-containing protein [Acetobacteraceae bacterium]